MSYKKQPKQAPLPLMDELRMRIPDLHPYTALILTLEPMLQEGEITSEEYLKWAAALVASQKKGLFSKN